MLFVIPLLILGGFGLSGLAMRNSYDSTSYVFLAIATLIILVVYFLTLNLLGVAFPI